MVVRFGGAWRRAEPRRSRGRDQVLGSRGLASLGPFLGAPAGSPEQVKFSGGTRPGAWHPLTPSWVPPSRWKWTVYEMAIVVCQYHRSWRRADRGVSCHRSWKS